MKYENLMVSEMKSEFPSLEGRGGGIGVLPELPFGRLPVNPHKSPESYERTLLQQS
jgi:hypothetical protein